MSNIEHIKEWEDDPWYPAILMCHKNISRVVPNYTITQIKNKFGGLRYYSSLPSEEDIDWDIVPAWVAYSEDRMADLRRWCDAETRAAEAWVCGYEEGRREERGWVLN